MCYPKCQPQSILCSHITLSCLVNFSSQIPNVSKCWEGKTTVYFVYHVISFLCTVGDWIADSKPHINLKEQGRPLTHTTGTCTDMQVNQPHFGDINAGFGYLRITMWHWRLYYKAIATRISKPWFLLGSWLCITRRQYWNKNVHTNLIIILFFCGGGCYTWMMMFCFKHLLASWKRIECIRFTYHIVIFLIVMDTNAFFVLKLFVLGICGKY